VGSIPTASTIFRCTQSVRFVGCPRLDLLVFDDESGTLSVYRGLNGGLAPAWSIRTDRDVHGHVFLADVNQDGNVEFLAITEEGKFVHNRTD